MVTRSRSSPRSEPTEQAARPKAPDPYYPTSPIPLPEVIEKDSDSVWAMWNDAVEGGEEPPPKDFDTHAATLIMDLPDLPKPSDDS